MRDRIVAYCGLICDEECPAYSGTRTGDPLLLRATAEKWSSPDYVLEVKDVLCDGCTERNKRLAEICSDCRVRACGEEKELKNCGLCADYPCGHLEKLWEVLKIPQARDRLDQFRMESSVSYF